MMRVKHNGHYRVYGGLTIASHFNNISISILKQQFSGKTALPPSPQGEYRIMSERQFWLNMASASDAVQDAVFKAKEDDGPTIHWYIIDRKLRVAIELLEHARQSLAANRQERTLKALTNGEKGRAS